MLLSVVVFWPLAYKSLVMLVGDSKWYIFVIAKLGDNGLEPKLAIKIFIPLVYLRQTYQQLIANILGFAV